MGSKFRKEGIQSVVNDIKKSISKLEIKDKEITTTDATSVPEVVFTSIHTAKSKSYGQVRINPVSASSGSAINEETNVAVAAYASLDDIGGSGSAPITSPFDSTNGISVPLTSFGGKSGFYHVSKTPHKAVWSAANSHIISLPTVNHQKIFLTGKSFGVCIPTKYGIPHANGTYYNYDCVYFNTSTDFNIGQSFSIALWFYPTDLTTVSGTFRTLAYRYQDDSNYVVIGILPSDNKVYSIVNDAVTTTRRVSTNTVNLNSWNLIAVTFVNTTDTLVINLNDANTHTSTAQAYTPPLTTNTGLFFGNIPVGNGGHRFTGYITNPTFWKTKALTNTEMTNLFERGTIVTS